MANDASAGKCPEDWGPRTGRLLLLQQGLGSEFRGHSFGSDHRTQVDKVKDKEWIPVTTPGHLVKDMKVKSLPVLSAPQGIRHFYWVYP